MVRMELNCFVEKSSSLKRDQVPYLLMYNEFMCDTLVTDHVFNRHCINNIGFHMNTLIKLVILNSPNKNNKDIPATDFWRLLQDHITKKYLSIWLCINLRCSIFLQSRAMIKQLLIILSQTCCIMLISFNLYCRWGRKHPSLWQPCCIFTFYLYRYTYLCYILQFQAQRYRPTKKRGQSQLKLPSICFWENFPTTKNVS